MNDVVSPSVIYNMVKLYITIIYTCQFSLRFQPKKKMACNFNNVISSQKYKLFVWIRDMVFICIDY